MLSVEMLPAGNGDGLWIEYGSAASPRRILIDGGTRATQRVLAERIRALPTAHRKFDLMVLTHVDMDHIGGMLRVWQDPSLNFEAADFWINGRQHLDAADVLGPREGEMLTRIVRDRAAPWNKAFNEGPVVVPDDAPLPAIDLDGETKLTVLSPYRQQLKELVPAWEKAIEELEAKEEVAHPGNQPVDLLGDDVPNVDRLAAERFNEDSAEANGSSIAFLFEHAGRAVLFGADAFPSVLERSIRRLLKERGLNRLKLDAYKVSHHGSRANNSPDLLGLLECQMFLFSTNGVGHEHPDQQTVAWILKSPSPGPKALVFNYRSRFNEPWDNGPLMRAYGYSVEYPAAATGGIRKMWP